MKNLKDEIEGIIKDNAFPYDGEGWGWRIPGTDIEIIAEEITSLIQQEKERAVREFGGWWNNKYERERTMRGYFTEDIREIYPVDIEQYLAERKDV